MNNECSKDCECCECHSHPKTEDEEHLWLVGVSKEENAIIPEPEPGKTVFLSLEQAIEYAHKHNMRVHKLIVKKIDVKEIHYEHLANGQYKISNCCTFGTLDDGRTFWRRIPWYLRGD